MPLGLYSRKLVYLRTALSSIAVLLCLVLGACTNLPKPMEASGEHLTLPEPRVSEAPPLAEIAPLPPPPKATPATERYSVVVNNVQAQEILFALARDAKLNIEIHPNIAGTVTMNLLDQTLPEILDAIGRQIDMRYELNGRNLAIMPDSPFLKIYHIDYPNVVRNSENSISTSTSVATIGQGSSGGGGGGGNASSSTINNISNNHFWETLIENIKDLLRETDKTMPESLAASAPAAAVAAPPVNPLQAVTSAVASSLGGALGGTTYAAPPATPAPAVPAAPAAQGQSPAAAAVPARVSYREAASVIANPESGTISVRATSKQQASVREFIDKVMVSVRRQVLIEATIVEVALTDQFQQGIDWSIVNKASGLSFNQVTPEGANTAGMSSLGPLTYGTLAAPASAQGGRYDLTASIKLLETFGKLHVLSSPKLSVLNNQTSLLKVVDESVYFTIEVTPGTAATATSPATPAIYTSNVHTLPVGFLMYVTPQVGNDAEVTLNLRPTISRIVSYATDPNPALKQNDIKNLIPQIQTREMESILRVRNGEIAVLGGLMQDTRSGDTNQLPGVGGIPILGELFKARNDTNSKSELVIFLRPVILDGEGQYDVSRLFKNSAGIDEWQSKKPKGQAAP